MTDWMLGFREMVDLRDSSDGGVGGGRQRVLPFDMQHQEQDNWCWAAVSVSVDHGYDNASHWTQCRMANEELNRADCCGPGGPTACNQYGTLDTALRRVGHLERVTSSAESFPAIMNTIDAGNPLGCRTAWRGGGAHFVIIGGYLQGNPQLNEPDVVAVHDPWYGESRVPYDRFRSAYQGSGAWTHGFYCRR